MLAVSEAQHPCACAWVHVHVGLLGRRGVEVGVGLNHVGLLGS